MPVLWTSSMSLFAFRLAADSGRDGVDDVDLAAEVMAMTRLALLLLVERP